jgi:hypothetical protein
VPQVLTQKKLLSNHDVGLFGDSYACYSLDFCSGWFQNPLILSNYNLYSYAEAGSDITWSYKLFLKHHSKYTKNIFIVTESTRHSFTLEPYTVFVSNIDHIKKNLNDSRIDKILDALYQHYVHTLSTDLYDFGLAGMVENIKRIRPDTIIIYAFYNHSIEKITGNEFYLSQVSLMELDAFKIDFNFMKKNGLIDKRSAHMTVENNQIFAQYIRERLDGNNATISLNDFIVPKTLDKQKYF